MPHSCRTHCPSRSGLPWLFDLLLALALLTGAYWLLGRAAVVVDVGASTVLSWLLPTLVVSAAGVAVVALVTALRNRRALAAYERIEREAWAEPVEPVEPAALPSPPRELEAAPIRVEAFRVEGQCVAERDAA